jgi:hypothetical protein
VSEWQAIRTGGDWTAGDAEYAVALVDGETIVHIHPFGFEKEIEAKRAAARLNAREAKASER